MYVIYFFYVFVSKAFDPDLAGIIEMIFVIINYHKTFDHLIFDLKQNKNLSMYIL